MNEFLHRKYSDDEEYSREFHRIDKIDKEENSLGHKRDRLEINIKEGRALLKRL